MKSIIVEKSLDEIDQQILMLIAEGKTIKEIAWKVGKKHTHIDYRLKTMRKYFNCINNVHLIAKLSETA